MPRIIFTVFAFVLYMVSFAQVCTPDTTQYDFFYPPSEDFPCIERNVPFNGTITFFLPASFAGANVTSATISGITGLPNGLTTECFPSSCTVPGGQHGCIQVSGITSDTVGFYDITIAGFVVSSLGTFSFAQLSQFSGIPLDYALHVVEQASDCEDVNTGLQETFTYSNQLIIYPNPSSTTITISKEYFPSKEGVFAILDASGKKVLHQSINELRSSGYAVDVSMLQKGIYIAQVITESSVSTSKVVLE